MNPQVSIIMPMHNAEPHVAAAIGSLLTQTLADFELLLVDDVSSDGSWAAAAALADPRIRRWRNPHRFGAAATRNRALREARAELVAFLDSDDLAHPTRLEKQVAFLRRHPAVSVLGAQVQIIGAGQRHNPKLRRRGEEIPATLLFENCLAQSAVMLRRCILPPDPFCTELEPAEDYHLWARLAPVATFCNLDETLVQYRHHPGGISTRRADGMKAAERAIAALQLGRLDLAAGGADLDLHLCLAAWPVDATRDQLHRADLWLRRLGAAHRARPLYEQATFRRILADRWCRVCGDAWPLGIPAWLAFWQSPLSRCAPPPIVPLARLLRHALPQSLRSLHR